MLASQSHPPHLLSGWWADNCPAMSWGAVPVGWPDYVAGENWKPLDAIAFTHLILIVIITTVIVMANIFQIYFVPGTDGIVLFHSMQPFEVFTITSQMIKTH